jgi:hypothetical protein
MAMAAGHPAVKLLKSGLRLAPATRVWNGSAWVLDNTYGDKEMLKREDAAVNEKLAALYVNRWYDYSFVKTRTTHPYDAIFCASGLWLIYWDSESTPGHTNIMTETTGGWGNGNNYRYTHPLSYREDGQFMWWEQPGYAAFSKAAGDSISGPAIFRVNKDQSRDTEKWWLTFRGAYFRKIDNGGYAKNSDSPVGRYQLVEDYKNQMWVSGAWLQTDIAGNNFSPAWTPGTTPPSQGKTWDVDCSNTYYGDYTWQVRVVDAYCGYTARSNTSPYNFPQGSGSVWYQPGKPPQIDITLHDRRAPEAANAFELSWSTASPQWRAGDGITGVGITQVQFRFRIDYPFPCNYTYFAPPICPTIEDGQDIYFWKDGDAEPGTPSATITADFTTYPVTYDGYKCSSGVPTPLLSGTKYHVRVNTYNWDGDGNKQVTTGPDWTFTTA